MNITEKVHQKNAHEILRALKSYEDMKKKLGRRGKEMFVRMLTGEKAYLVEYFPNLGEDNAWSQAQLVFEKSFSLSPKKEQVLLVASENIKGGMKVYVDDMMVDMSYKKVENTLQK